MKHKPPLILFVFLSVLVACLVVSVVIAIKNPVKDDESYFLYKKELDSVINDIIKDHRYFPYKLYVGLDEAPNVSEQALLLPPYLQIPNRYVLDLSQKGDHFIFLRAWKKDHDIPKLKILVYLERINASLPVMKVGEMILNSHLYRSPLLPKLNQGRYKAIFEVEYIQNEAPKHLIFEKEIFVRP